MNAADAIALHDTTHIDVLIVGAGISGIGSAYHLQDQCPGKSYAILEMKDSFGGTWETHKYPGVRSDSDLYTFGYRFKPWVDAPIASAAEILRYMGEVIEENGIGSHIHYGHRITRAAWDSHANLWTVEAVRKTDGAQVTFTANFLWMCQGYYDHEKPYLPDWPGMADYKGTLIHAQLWDPKTDYTGKRILVIGSGATAATVIPAFAEKAAHVTMLQRSPTYFFASPNVNELADKLRAGKIDEPTIHRVVRTQIMHDQDALCRRCVDEPDAVVAELQEAIKAIPGLISSSSRILRRATGSGSSGWPLSLMGICFRRWQLAKPASLPMRSRRSPQPACAPRVGPRSRPTSLSQRRALTC